MSWGDVKDIKLQNEIFTDSLCLRWHAEDNRKKEHKSSGAAAKEIRNVLIYGRNGSGKTSIARAIANMSTTDGIPVCRLYGGNGEQIPLNDALQENVFIFNEDYIDKNIRIDKEGLSSIVIFGEQVELDNRIKELEKQIVEEQNKEKEINANKAELEKSCGQSLEKIFQRLKENEGWAARAGNIKGNKIHDRVNEKTINDIMACQNMLSIEDIKAHYEQGIKQLNNIKKGVRIPERPVNIRSVTQINEENIIRLVNRSVKRPVLEEREKHIIELLQSTGSQELRTIKDAFQNEKTEYCPFCFRPISSAEKQELVEAIEKILTNELKQYIRELRNAKLGEIDLNISPYESVNEDLVIKIRGKILDINQKIQKYNRLLEEKENDIFQNVECNNMGLSGDYDELIQRVNQLNEEWAIYQQESENIKKLKEHLLELNNMLGKEEIKDLYAAYIKEKKKCDESDQTLAEIGEKLSKKEALIAELRAKKINVDVAVKEINDKLYCVFLSKNRLQVKIKDREYHLLVRGDAVQPKQISTGERNLLALCFGNCFCVSTTRSPVLIRKIESAS